MILSAINDLLAATPAVTAICGPRIYPVALATGSLFPALVMQVISTTPHPTLDTSGMQRVRVEFNAWGEQYQDAENLRKALVQALNGYQGTLTDGTNLQNVELIQAGDFYQDDPRVWRCMLEMYFFFTFNNA